jgi:hypothetical protein
LQRNRSASWDAYTSIAPAIYQGNLAGKASTH